MKLKFLTLACCIFPLMAYAQTIGQKLSSAIGTLESDPQFKFSGISILVKDAKTGKTVFDKNSRMGMVPASCLKIVTSVAALELLGKEYTYNTTLSYSGSIKQGMLQVPLILTASGDPTFGSWRWNHTNRQSVFNKILQSLKQSGIKSFPGIVIDISGWGTQTIPDGWIWEDIGNYYGAGCGAFNWHENQFDILLKPGKSIGDKVGIISGNQAGIGSIVSELTTAPTGSGDQAYAYYSLSNSTIYLRGTIPLGSETFGIKAAAADGIAYFAESMNAELKKSGYSDKCVYTPCEVDCSSFATNDVQTICTFESPGLDSINYWFLKKSVNLFGEAFVKTIGFEKSKSGTTDSGISVIRNFWSTKGISMAAMKILDGSGLSPANRITAEALVTVLQYAKTRPWYNSFMHALPEINGIIMKDGYMEGVRSFAGYAKARDGNEYVFSFIVNNYDGSPKQAREKMWKILDILK